MPRMGPSPRAGLRLPSRHSAILSLKHLSRGVKNAELKAEGKSRLGFFFRSRVGVGRVGCNAVGPREDTGLRGETERGGHRIYVRGSLKKR